MRCTGAKLAGRQATLPPPISRCRSSTPWSRQYATTCRAEPSSSNLTKRSAMVSRTVSSAVITMPPSRSWSNPTGRWVRSSPRRAASLAVQDQGRAPEAVDLSLLAGRVLHHVRHLRMPAAEAAHVALHGEVATRVPPLLHQVLPDPLRAQPFLTRSLTKRCAPAPSGPAPRWAIRSPSRRSGLAGFQDRRSRRSGWPVLPPADAGIGPPSPAGSRPPGDSPLAPAQLQQGLDLLDVRHL